MKFLTIFSLILISSTSGLACEEQEKPLDRGTASAAVGSSKLTDKIKKIRDDDEGVVILFETNKGAYYLRRHVAEFEGIKKKLNEAFQNKASVTVTFDPGQLNILEVK